MKRKISPCVHVLRGHTLPRQNLTNAPRIQSRLRLDREFVTSLSKLPSCVSKLVPVTTHTHTIYDNATCALTKPVGVENCEIHIYNQQHSTFMKV